MNARDVISDFDEIAALQSTSRHADVLSAAERAVLAHVPQSACRILDVGCGDGIITRALARADRSIVGVDLSPGMIALAKRRAEGLPGLSYCVCDIMSDEVHGGPFDAIVTVNTLHHLPLAPALERLQSMLAPGGVLVIQDVLDRGALRYLPMNIVAAIKTRVRRLLRRSRINREIEKRYHEHGAGEKYLSPQELQGAYAHALPGATIMKHLEWRYTVVWVNR